jgi:hypothetical protein
MWHCDSAWLYASTKLHFIICYVDSSCHLHCRLVDYMGESRNLLRVHDSTMRRKFLYQGPVAIVACLRRLPKTQAAWSSVICCWPHTLHGKCGIQLLVQQALLSNVQFAYFIIIHIISVSFSLSTLWPYHNTHCAAAAAATVATDYPLTTLCCFHPSALFITAAIYIPVKCSQLEADCSGSQC